MSLLLLSFRETLEAALIIGAALVAISEKTTRRPHGALLGIVGGCVFALLLFIGLRLELLAFSSQATTLSGILSLCAASMLAVILIGTERTKHKRKPTTAYLGNALSDSVGMLCFVTVLREGTELAMMLQARPETSMKTTVVWTVIGIISAIIVTIIVFRTTSRSLLRYVFRITTILLLVFGASLVSEGIQDLLHADILHIGTWPWMIDLGTFQVFTPILPILGDDGHLPLIAALISGLYLMLLVSIVYRVPRSPSGNHRA
jgi:FTR1 family protein